MDPRVASILNNPALSEWIKTQNITPSIVQKNLNVILEFLKFYKRCIPGPLSQCEQSSKGYRYIITKHNNNLYLSTTHCDHWLYENPNHLVLNNLKITDYDKTKETLTLEIFLTNPSSKTTLEQNQFLNAMSMLLKKGFEKGVYLYGEIGIGKTFLMRRIAASLAKQDKQVAFIGVGELIKNVKSTFGSNTKDVDLDDVLMGIDVLFLDDIGGEQVTNWSRDELLFTILNSRMNKHLLTFFTSNFALGSLVDRYAIKNSTNEPKIEKTLNLRFIERIRTLAVGYELIGPNLRK